MCKSGVDVAALLQTFGVSEAFVEKLSKSEMGYAALAYACYKIATPARYTVTVGGTTMTVKYLSDLGYLKTSHQVAEQFKEKADTIKQDVKDTVDDMRERQDKLKDEWSDAWHKFAQKRKKKTDCQYELLMSSCSSLSYVQYRSYLLHYSHPICLRIFQLRMHVRLNLK